MLQEGQSHSHHGERILDVCESVGETIAVESCWAGFLADGSAQFVWQDSKIIEPLHKPPDPLSAFLHWREYRFPPLSQVHLDRALLHGEAYYRFFAGTSREGGGPRSLAGMHPQSLTPRARCESTLC